MKPTMKIAKSLLPDALMVVGMAGITYGVGAIYRPAGWIVAGAFAFSFGLLLARRGGEA